MPIFIFSLALAIVANFIFLYEAEDNLKSILWFGLLLLLICLETFMVLLQTGFASLK